MNTRFFDPPLPRLIAHRGFSARYPENTLTAFQAAVEAGILYLELDVWLSRDQKLVVHHDRTCERTCGDPRVITELAVTELKTLDAGFGFSPDDGKTFPFRNRDIFVPTLAEVLNAFPEVFFTIEIKEDAPGLEEVLLDTICTCGREDGVLIGSAVDSVMPKIRRHCQGIPTGCSHGEAAAFFQSLQKGQCPPKLPAEVLHLPMYYGDTPLISPPVVQAARAMGLEIHVWTVNDTVDIEKLLAMGVSGITGDYPDRLVEIAKNYQ